MAEYPTIVADNPAPVKPPPGSRPLPPPWEAATQQIAGILRPLGPVALDWLLAVACADGAAPDAQQWTPFLNRLGWLLLNPLSPQPCPACDGSGIADYAAVPCDLCGGSGQA